MPTTETAAIALVTTDGEATFAAAAVLPGTWNGFLRPLFTADEALRILSWHNAGTEESVMRDDRSTLPGGFTICESDGSLITRFEVVEHDGRMLYPIGTDAWTWTLHVATDLP